MDMYIDRHDSFLLDNQEIDLVCEAVENVLFKEFFEQTGSILSIHCVDKLNDMDRVIYCHNKADKGLQMIVENVGVDGLFEEYYSKVYDYPVPLIEVRGTKVHGTNILMSSIGMKLDCGHVFTYTGSTDPYSMDMMGFGLFGLAMTFCRMLSKHDKSAKTLGDLLRNANFNFIEKTAQNAIVRQIDHLFDGNSKAVVNWKNA